LIVYVDASAGSKLFLEEAESTALKRHLGAMDDDDVLVSAILLETELRRAAVRQAVEQSVVTSVLEPIDLIGIPRSLFSTAGIWPDPHLRSLDAVHLAAAVRAGADAVLSYDHRMQDAAHAVGIEVLAPA
jgi:uncharacterized protein